MTKLEIFHVEWIDSTSINAWHEVEELDECIEITHTVGIMVKETFDSLVLALSYDPSTDSVNCYKHIPIACVQSKKRLCLIPLK